MTSNSRSIAQLFKLHLDDMFNEWSASKPMRSGYPHASAILAPDSDYCLRKLVLLCLRPEEAKQPDLKAWDAHTNAIFLNGWVLHEKYQDLFKKFGQVVEVETSHFDETRLLHFTPDAIIEFASETMVVEIKGYKSSTFDGLNEMGPAPKAAHVQANLYMHLLDLKYALILVENKDTQAYKVWCVEYSKDMVQPQLDRMHGFKVARIKAAIGHGLPDRSCTTCTDRQAQKCPVQGVCFREKE